jgi:hypothetical protein
LHRYSLGAGASSCRGHYDAEGPAGFSDPI